MRIFLDDLKTRFAKVETENTLLKSKVTNIKELLSDVK